MLPLSTIKPAYRIPLVVSLGLHVFMIVFLSMTSTHHEYRAASAGERHPIVHAVALNQAAVDKAVKQLDQVQHAKQRSEAKALKQLQRQKRHEARRLAAQRAQQKRLKQQLKLAQKQQAAVTAKLAKEKAMQKVLARRRSLEKQRLAKKAKELQEELLKNQLAGEKKKANLAHNRGIFDRYRALIISQIEKHWVIPPGDAANKSMCQLLVHLAPGGKVLSVKLLRSSGRASIDRSARLAVIHASPLPVPKDAALFESMKVLRLTLRPADYRHL